MKKPIVAPNLGLYLDRPSIAVPDGALSDCRNVRIINGRISALNLGWEKFITRQLSGPVLLIDNFFIRDGSQFLIFGTQTDLYLFDEANRDVVFLTPSYVTGTLAITDGSADITGTGTTWSTSAKAGDRISFDGNDINDPDATWYTIETVGGDTSLTLSAPYSGTDLSGSNYTLRRVFSGTDTDYWSSTSFLHASPDDEDLWIATNGIDPLVQWNSVDRFASLRDDIDLKAKYVTIYKNRAIYSNITYSGEERFASIRTSVTGNPMDVTTVPDSAEFVVQDGTSPILAAYVLGDNLAIYSRRSVILAQFIGGDVKFAFRTVVDGMGPIGGNVVASFGDHHEVVAADGQYRFDGVSFQQIGTQVWREVLRKQSPQRRDKAFCHFDEEHGDLLWIVPLNTDSDPQSGPPETAYVEHYLEEVGRAPTPFTARDAPFTASGHYERKDTLRFSDLTRPWEEYNFRWNDQFFQAAFPFNLFGDASGYIFTLNTVETKDGVNMSHSARFGRRSGASGNQKTLIKRVYPFAASNPGASLSVKVYGSSHASGDPALLSNSAFDLDLPDPEVNFVSPFVIARYFEVEFASKGDGWELEGYDGDLLPAGSR